MISRRICCRHCRQPQPDSHGKSRLQGRHCQEAKYNSDAKRRIGQFWLESVLLRQDCSCQHRAHAHLEHAHCKRRLAGSKRPSRCVGR